MLVCLNVSEIGSCSNLTIISVRNNKLQEVPAELGHLPSIRMINLSENLLCNLPVSILKLSHLTALWLSNNQNTPLVTLHKEIDKETRQTVCVNFMLPQTIQDRYVALPKGTANNSNEEHTPRSHPHIWFATETTEDKSCGLLRAPTPYPKELRAMSKHVRNMQQSSKRASRENILDTVDLDKVENIFIYQTVMGGGAFLDELMINGNYRLIMFLLLNQGWIELEFTP
uniref:Uncharacterized protein n=1 Tax=Timema douglasi TaxID=61478 RepID=A0A7R8Z690_TIMDO|nr:unnamed protein product [Timema douglasi]